MQYTKRGMLIGLWLLRFVLAAPAPLYRLLFAQVNDVALDSPVTLSQPIGHTPIIIKILDVCSGVYPNKL